MALYIGPTEQSAFGKRVRPLGTFRRSNRGETPRWNMIGARPRDHAVYKLPSGNHRNTQTAMIGFRGPFPTQGMSGWRAPFVRYCGG